MQQYPMPGAESNANVGNIFGGTVGGASSMHQAQKLPMTDPFGFLNPMAMTGSQATPQQQKDYRVLMQTLGETCVKKCNLKRERDYHVDMELCQAKCYDISFIYTRVGLNEINEFTTENNIRV